jgi:predicted transcriptional regulator
MAWSPAGRPTWWPSRLAATTTKTGLKVECVLDERTYEKGIKVSDAEMDALDIRGDTFHPEWNYTVHPRPAK